MWFVNFADFPPLFQSFSTHFASSNQKLWPKLRLHFGPFPSMTSINRFEIHSKLDSISPTIDSKLCSSPMNGVQDRCQNSLRCHLSPKSSKLKSRHSWTTCCWQLTRNQFLDLELKTVLDDHMEDAKLEKPLLTCNVNIVTKQLHIFNAKVKFQFRFARLT